MTPFHRYFFSLSIDQRSDLALRCDTTPQYLEQIARKYKKPSGDLAIDLERETGLEGLCEELRPTADWAYIRASTLPTGV